VSSFNVDEQQITTQHFDAHSAWWYEVYYDETSFTGYGLRKQQAYVTARLRQRGESLRVLDAGCGAGVVAIALAEAGHNVSGIDIAPRMIERAVQEAELRGLSCDFRVGSADALPYRDAAFDAVVAMGLLANLPDDRAALREMLRVLKPGGLLMATMPNTLALDVLVALPLSFPIMLEGTRLRKPFRMLANVGRRVTRRPVKPIATMKPGQSVMPMRYRRVIQAAGYHNVCYTALVFGPLMPFGLLRPALSTQITFSERFYHLVERATILRWLGSVIMYEGEKSQS